MQKSDIGFYGYASTQPHAVTSVSQLSGDAFSTKYNKITYNSFNSVAKAELSATEGSAVTNTYTLTYGPDNQRRISNSDGAETIYTGLYEVRSNGNKLHYIPTPDGLCGLIVTNGTTQTNYYLHNDHLGSLVAEEAQDGTLTEFSYDPWGRRRSSTNWNDYNVTIPTLFTRGFTGHSLPRNLGEHMDSYGLINMNGRVYDPRLGRMLSPDNNVQLPDFSQNFNRYSYCMNNPLMYTDPSGENFLGIKSPGEWLSGLFGSDDNNDGVVGDRVFGGDAKQYYTDYLVFSNMMVISAAIGGSAGAYVGGLFFPAQAGFGYGFTFGLTSGFTRGFLTGSSFTWYKGGSFEDGLRNGGIFGLHEGLSDAVTYSTMFGLASPDGLTFLQFVGNNNIRHNMDVFEGGDLKFHFMFGGYNVSTRTDYWIWSDGLSDGERFDMAMETIWGASLIPNGDYKFEDSHYNNPKRANPTFWKKTNSYQQGSQYKVLEYRFQDELITTRGILMPLWYYFTIDKN